jgi:hypothetical protein
MKITAPSMFYKLILIEPNPTYYIYVKLNCYFFLI